jgi:hypothetical protein
MITNMHEGVYGMKTNKTYGLLDVSLFGAGLRA